MDIFLWGKRKRITAGILALICCFFMVAFPVVALSSARKGISLWMSNVLPALLPFFICANFLQGLGVVRVFKGGSFPFIMSVLSGYPMGAKIIGDMKRSGEITLREAKRLVSFCSTSGPAFIAGAVGAGMLGSAAMGGIIAAAHYGGAVINGALYTRLLGRDPSFAAPERLTPLKGIQQSLTDSILSSLKSLGIILAYIVLFMWLTDMIHMCGGLSFVPGQETRALAKGFFEMTVGCEAVSECVRASEAAKCVMCSALISWGGLSVAGQSMSMLSGTGISFGYILLTKFTHSLFSAGAAFIAACIVL
ncbi:MAG TPA: hypothetical protein IAC50_01665 [Candidatus Copromorpha excrementigallinarum]|uniref:Nucleoside transporter/FeoB GTPase Gate domain-containing protein n=1 Tax=Candidatus Allocopromorpha excrementigallinarum TaxID=2840742 RepID=A0A9D1L5R7_9FIRM|nr:hypothetical protein [Candidatus Copromorpha excrementigallinarum]